MDPDNQHGRVSMVRLAEASGVSVGAIRKISRELLEMLRCQG